MPLVWAAPRRKTLLWLRVYCRAGWVWPPLSTLLLALLLGGCQPRLAGLEPRDVQELPQRPSAYLAAATADQPLLTADQQQERLAQFRARHFAAWQWQAGEQPGLQDEGLFWALDWLQRGTAYGENLRPLTAERCAQLVARTAAADYPSLWRPAISVARCEVRALPTARPLLGDPARAGSGFPFDLLQHGVLPPATPLRVTHQSPDGSWLLVETALLQGWVPAQQVAWVDEELMAWLEAAPLVVILRDEQSLHDGQGRYRGQVGLATLLPLAPEPEMLLLPLADALGWAWLVPVRRPAAAQDFPLPLTAARLAALADSLMGQPYGWGELYGNRDCSALVRDLFVPFGLWLPRNSAAQARAGQVVELKHLDPAQREQALLQHGQPFVTLVHLPGHILLYLGAHQGRAALLHNLWGLRTRDLWGREGRWLVGRTLISSLQPGLEQDGLLLRIGDLRQRVERLTLLLASPSP